VGLKTLNAGFNAPLQGTPSNTVSWQECRSASGNAIYLTGVSYNNDAPYTGSPRGMVMLSIATGAVGAETIVTKVPLDLGGVGGASARSTCNSIPLRPYVPIAASTRISMKTDNGTPINIQLQNIDQANVASF
jgi:hypothetical protein